MSQGTEAINGIISNAGGEGDIISGATSSFEDMFGIIKTDILGEYDNIGEKLTGDLFGDGNWNEDLINGFSNYFGINPEDVKKLVDGENVMSVAGDAIGKIFGNSTISGIFNAINNGDYSAIKKILPEKLQQLWPEASSSGATVKKTAKLNMTNTANALKDNISYSKTSGKTLNYSGNTTNSTTRPVLTSEAVYKPFKTPVTTAATSLTQVKRISSTIQLEVSRVRTAIVNSNNNLNRQFTNLNNHLSRIDSDIKNMKLYLDGNKLVGGIIARVDSSLGRRQSISRRTN